MSALTWRPSGVLVVLIVGLVVGGVAQASVIYVDKNAGATNNGSSWATGYTDLQTALGAAGSGDEIWVAEGTYKPASGTDRTISFALENGVALYGGFDGSEGARSERNWSLHETILSGDIGTEDVSTDNAYHVVKSNQNDGSAVLDGFTITGGNASGNTATGYGGGMYNSSSSPTVANCTFNSNSADYLGGGMYNFYSSPTVTNCTFSNNTANDGGGGMFNKTSSSPTVINCTFSGNFGGFGGGGMCNYKDSSPTLTNCTFSNNTARYGGGMYNESSSSPTVTNCTFSENFATFANGGGMCNYYGSSPTVINCTFSNNTASDFGGGMYNCYSSPTVRNTILWGDTAILSGDEIYNPGSSASTVDYCVVEGGYAGGTNITADPLLGTLGDHGGATETIPLLEGSSAIDAANATYAPDTDQRGVTRPQGTAYDIGAYEAPIVGDVNNDGVINILDVRLCLQIALGVIPGTAAQRQRADRNGDGQVTLTDAQLLADYIIAISH